MHPMRQVQVNFRRTLQRWDGFGVNYVETSQTRDYDENPQEYGGLSTLGEKDRAEILDMIFGREGLCPGVVKMFLDPWHQEQPSGIRAEGADRLDQSAYDHESTTEWMRYFVREGLARTKARGSNLSIITTLYGPPAWMTCQGFVRGRDLDKSHRRDLARYMISWVKFLREQEGFPVDYISLHNEGEDWMRWPIDGSTADQASHDYNLYWPPEQVVEMMGMLGEMLPDHGLDDVGIAPGETTNWYRFHHYGYPDAILHHEKALTHLGLITSHGFYGGSYGRWYGDHRSAGIDMLREAKPELHAWTTSTSWSKMDVFFLNEIRNQIYAAKINALIPWAIMQTSDWVGGDPNPGTAFSVDGQGAYTVEPGYFFYKQVCPAGQPGMRVATVRSNDPTLGVIAFSGGDTEHPDALILLNLDDNAKGVRIDILGSNAREWAEERSSPHENNRSLGNREMQGEGMDYVAPPLSATTFYAR